MTWNSVKLGDVITLKRGYDLPEGKREEGDAPILSSSGVTGFHKEAKVRGPGVVTGRYGTLGEVFYVEEDFWPLNTTLYVQDFKGNDVRFISYFLRTVNLSDQNSAGAVPGINRNFVHALDVKVPNVPTQHRIVSILGAYDNLIANNLKRIALLEESARLLYKEWFVNLCFPSYERANIIDGVPKGWERAALEEALVLQRGYDLPVQARQWGEVPIYGSAGVNGHHNLAKAKGPGIVTGRSGTLGAVHYIAQDFWPLNTALWVREFKRVSPLYAFFLLKELKLEQYNGGASVPTLDRKAIHRLPILIPSQNQIELFDSYVGPMFEMIQKLRSSNERLRQACDLLLPKLVSGEIVV